jgi:hypothetical protein
MKGVFIAQPTGIGKAVTNRGNMTADAACAIRAPGRV